MRQVQLALGLTSQLALKLLPHEVLLFLPAQCAHLLAVWGIAHIGNEHKHINIELNSSYSRFELRSGFLVCDSTIKHSSTKLEHLCSRTQSCDISFGKAPLMYLDQVQ